MKIIPRDVQISFTNIPVRLKKERHSTDDMIHFSLCFKVKRPMFNGILLAMKYMLPVAQVVELKNANGENITLTAKIPMHNKM